MVYAPISPTSDFDEDGDVDADDLGIFEACATGPAVPYNPASLPELFDCGEDLEEDIGRMQQLHAIFRANRGQDRVTLLVRNGQVVTRLEPLDRVACSAEFQRQVEGLLGEGSVQRRGEP